MAGHSFRTAVSMEGLPEYRVIRAESDFPVPGEPSFGRAIPALKVSHYLWLDHGHRPYVEVRLCHSQQNLYVHYDVFEAKIRVRYTRFQDPVYKDSCVEFFVDPFPEKKVGYINLETNALGALLVAIGPGRNRRTPIPQAHLEGFEIVTSVKRPISAAGLPPSRVFWPPRFRVRAGIVAAGIMSNLRPPIMLIALSAFFISAGTLFPGWGQTVKDNLHRTVAAPPHAERT